MLKLATDEGYVITSFEKYNPMKPKTIIMRHDVDYGMDDLFKLAQIEAKLGCSSTFLFRIHADEYNLLSCLALATVQEIKGLGHEIGLHFEAMNVGRALHIEPQSLLKREKMIIECILGYSVQTCSEHREISGIVHKTPLFEEQYDPYEAGFRFYAMDKKYCKEMKYLSDSNANWREGDLTQHLNKHMRFQVLVHADWWFDKDMLLKSYHHPRSTHI